MNILFGLLAGVLGYFVAQLVFNDVISGLLGIIIFFAVAFTSDRWTRTRL